MFQAPQLLAPLYAVKPLPGVAPGARPPRAVESAAAEALLQALMRDAPGVAFSKAHARGFVAAAIAGEGRIGVDLEYRQPGRDIGAIAAWLGAPARDAASAYRVFTYREAYFKALAAWPDVALLRLVEAADLPDFQTPDGLYVRHEEAAPDFVLTLVWSARSAPRRLVVGDELPDQPEGRL